MYLLYRTSRSSLRILVKRMLGCVAVLAIGCPAVWATSYTFTNIADTNGSFSIKNQFNAGLEGLSINSAGTVAFWAGFGSSMVGVFAGNGGTVATIADNNGTLFSGFSGDPQINFAGNVAFVASLKTGSRDSGIFLEASCSCQR